MRGRFSPKYMGSLRSSSLLVPTSSTTGNTREGVNPEAQETTLKEQTDMTDQQKHYSKGKVYTSGS
jgi:hypothetical protein